ncbi:hypothetical protein BH09BAC1_BH09BAC1_28300 [soil metagenome]
MLSKKRKVILDTNLWLKFLLKGRLKAFGLLLLDDAIALMVSPQQRQEIRKVTRQLQSARSISKKQRKGVDNFVKKFSTCVHVATNSHFRPDPKDGYLLALSIDSHADYFITNDKPLLGLSPFTGTQIVTYRQFLESILGKA